MSMEDIGISRRRGESHDLKLTGSGPRSLTGISWTGGLELTDVGAATATGCVVTLLVERRELSVVPLTVKVWEVGDELREEMGVAIELTEEADGKIADCGRGLTVPVGLY